jgi:UDP-N-acetylmuramate--alanine ligase
MFERYKVIHFIGIGGIGMSGIAEVLHNLGYMVTGSDIAESQTTERLSGLGIKVYMGHRAGNINGAHVVVTSSAVSADNPEVAEAVKESIPVIPRAEMLAELGRLKYAVLVAGTHGKTTTTSFISTVLARAGFDPTVVIGGKLKALGTNARLGRGDFMVAEADESDGSFLKLNPAIGVVTNIDREHMEYFKTMDVLKRAFLDFINKVPFYGVSVLCADDANIRELLPRVHRRFFTYGFSDEADLRAMNIKKGFMSASFDVLYKGEGLGTISLPVAGMHNVLNCLAAIAVSLELNINFDIIREALEGFEGIARRLEFKGEAGGIKVYDDYGHHPVEINATLSAVRESMGRGKLVVVFQPHRHTRTRDLLEEFAGAFDYADRLGIMEIYSAGESPIEGVSTASLLKAMKKKAVHLKSKKAAAEFAAAAASRGDIVLTLGAGDVWKVADKVLGLLKDG